MAENKYIPDSDGVLVQHFTPEAQKSKPTIAGDIKKLVGKLFSKATQDTKASDLGRNDSRKEGEQVYTTDMGAIETGVSQKTVSTQEKISEETEKSTREAGDPSGLQAYQDKSEELQHNAFNPTSWMEKEKSDTENIMRGTAERDVAVRAAAEGADGDKIRAELYKTGNYQGLESVDEAARRIEDQIARDKKSKEPIFADDSSPEESLTQSDRNPSIVAAENDVEGHKNLNKINSQIDEDVAADAQFDREASGSSWIDAHKDNASSDRLETSDHNPSVEDAEADVEGHLKLNELNRRQDEAEAAQAKKDREAIGQRWSDMDKPEKPAPVVKGFDRHDSVIREELNADVAAARREGDAARDLNDRETSGKRWAGLESERPYPTDADGNPIRPVDAFTGSYGDEARDRIVEETLQGADEIGDRIGRPIEPGEIIVRRNPNRATLVEADEDPDIAAQRDRIRDRTRRAAPRWRRALAAAGLMALLFIPHDRGPVNPAVDAGSGSLPVVEAPYVPMPELPKEPRSGLPAFPETAATSPLDGLPKTRAVFPTKGPEGETIAQDKADFGGWFNAEWVKQYKLHHPDQFTGHDFDMRNMYDHNLLTTLKGDSRYQEAKQMFMDYIATHDIQSGKGRPNIDIKKKDDGSYDQILIDVPNPDGYQVPGIEALYNLVNQTTP